MDLKIRIGLRIKELRKLKGWSQEDLADRVDRSVDTISHLERGTSIPNLETTIALADEFGLTVDEFLPKGEGKSEGLDQAKVSEAVMILRNLDDRILDASLEYLRSVAKIT